MTNPRKDIFQSSYAWPLFAAFVWLSLMLPNVGLCITEPYGLWAVLTNLLLPAGFYMLLLSLSPRIGQASLVCFPFMFFTSFQLVLLHLYGRSVIATDMFLNFVSTNPSEATELLVGLGWFVLLVIVIYLTDIIGGIVGIVRRARLPLSLLKRARIAGILLMGMGVATMILATNYEKSYNTLEDIFPINGIKHALKAVKITNQLRKYPQTSASFKYDAHSMRPDSVPELYFLVIGETSRAQNWQLLGYERPTNPRLTRRSGLVAFPHAYSASNTTHKSVPMLLSHIQPENYDSLRYVKSIITAFKEAGFNTKVITAQEPNHSYIEYFCAEADSTDYVNLGNKLTDKMSDVYLLDPVADAITNRARKQLIVVHTYGSHFDYRDRYPRELAHFLPDDKVKASASCRSQLINAYDNTIYTTDYLLDSIASMIEQTGAIGSMIYASDHGEDIYDDERGMFLHASPIPSIYQVKVPLLIWMSPAYMQAYPDKARNAQAHLGDLISTSQAYFHTALDLAGISTPIYRRDHSLVSGTYKPVPLTYVTDQRECVLLQDLFNHYNMRYTIH